MYALLALLALGLLLAVHELGHLVAARLLGVSVPRFTLGFGPPVLSFHLFGTEYIIAAIPIGASATLHGMNPHTPGQAPTDRASYSVQRPWKRGVITLAGSLSNYLFALVTLLALYTSGTHVVVPLTVGTVTPGSEAARAQLLPGDRILSVDGQAVKGWSDFVEFIGQSPGRERTLVVARADETRVVQVRPRADERGVGRIGVSQQYVYREHSAGEALMVSLAHTQRVAAEAIGLVWGMVAGRDRMTDPPSSVAVVRQSSGAASSGLDSFLRVLVAISVALALVHLFPVPGLDGGRLLFLAIETARGRPVSPRVVTLVNTAGFLAITAVIVAVAIAEVRRALPSRPAADSPATPSLSPSDAGGPIGLGLVPDGGQTLGDAGAPPSPAPVMGSGSPPVMAKPPVDPGTTSDAGSPPSLDAGGTPGIELVSDAGSSPPDAGEATSQGPALDGGGPSPDAGVPSSEPGSVPDGGSPPADAGAADAG
jgi:regulator of sigma E protease